MPARALSQRIVRNALEATGVPWVQMTEYDAETGLVRTVASAGWHVEAAMRGLAAIARIQPDWHPDRLVLRADVNELNRQVYLEGKAIWAPLAKIAEGFIPPFAVDIIGRIVGVRYCLVCPLFIGGKVVGGLAFPSNDPPTTRLQRTCEGFAQQVALTLENAELSSALQVRIAELRLSRQRMIATEERVRREIAELLHSRVQSRLLVAWHRLGQYEELTARDPDAARRLIADVSDDIDRIREQEVRGASHLLHPSAVKVGLVPAVEALVEQFGATLPVELRVDDAVRGLDHPGDNQFPESVRLAIYRILEATLSNVVRHAGARRVEVGLEVEDGHVCLTVRDDGRGFDSALVAHGLGLSSIADRVDQGNGSWSIETAPGEGAVLRVRLPGVGQPGAAPGVVGEAAV